MTCPECGAAEEGAACAVSFSVLVAGAHQKPGEIPAQPPAARRQGAPVVRLWRCLCPARNTEGFLDHLRATGVDEAKALPGCLGWEIFTRDMPGEHVEFTLLTFWASAEALAAFAGDDAGKARLYPGDEVFAIAPDLDVTHYTLRERAHCADRTDPAR